MNPQIYAIYDGSLPPLFFDNPSLDATFMWSIYEAYPAAEMPFFLNSESHLAWIHYLILNHILYDWSPSLKLR